MPKAIGYIRVSTEKQELSPEAQEKKIRAMAEVQEIHLDSIINDEVSGKTLDRPGMQKVLDMVKSKSIDMVIVAKLDRLTRSVRDLQDLLELFNKTGVALVSVNESLDTHSAAGRLVINIMVSVFQWEREAIGERTRDALAVKKANGERVGTLPYGYSLGDDGKIIPNASEQNISVLIRMYRSHGYSNTQTANKLNVSGLKTRGGKPWKREYVANVLRNHVN